jgi:thioredoxin 1
MSALHLKDADFKKEVLDSDLPVLVDFWAAWCGPCKMIAPAVEELAKEFEGRMKVCKVDVDESPQTAGKFGIMSIPTLMFFKNGKAMGQLVGALSKSDLKKKMEEHL